MTTERELKNKSDVTNSKMKKLDAEGRQFAKWLDKEKFVYVGFALTDGLNMATSVENLIFTLRYFDTNFFPADKIHEWLSTPEGIALAAIETVFITATSFLASIFSEKDENPVKASIAILWPYLRTIFKGLKNAYKGIRSTILALDMFSGRDLRYLIMPVGLFLGAISAANRVCMRKFVEEPRKKYVKELSNILQEIQSTKLYFLSSLPTEEEKANYKNSYVLVNDKLYFVNEVEEIESDNVVKKIRLDDVPVQNISTLLFDLELLKPNDEADPEEKLKPVYLSNRQVHKIITSNGGHVPPAVGLDAETCQAFRDRMEKNEQSSTERTYGLIGAAYGGVVDGMYLFMGAMTLATLSSPVFIAMAVLSAIYSLTCIASRVFEEQDFQRQLDAKQAEVEFAICGKELELLLTELHRLSSPLHRPMDEETRTELQKEQVDLISEKMKEFADKRDKLSSFSLLSDTAVIFAGLRNGLTVYNTVMSLMFAVATINALTSTVFPPAFLIACICSGLACLIGCVAYALKQHVDLKEEHQEKDFDPDSKLNEFLEKVKKDIKEARKLTPTKIREGITHGTKVVRSPMYDIPIVAEAGRSFMAGISKGITTVNTAGGYWQVPDSDGHYHDTPLLRALALCASGGYATVMFLRAIGKGFGTPDLTIVDEDEAVNRDAINTPDDEEILDYILSEFEKSGNSDKICEILEDKAEDKDKEEMKVSKTVPPEQHPPSVKPQSASLPTTPQNSATNSFTYTNNWAVLHPPPRKTPGSPPERPRANSCVLPVSSSDAPLPAAIQLRV